MSDFDEGILIEGGGLKARVNPMGATLRDLRLVADDRPLLMAFADARQHQSGPTYANTIVGRVANRLAGGRACVDGTAFQLECNGGSYHLHGGRIGFSHRDWTIVNHRADSLTLRLPSADGDQGYPGQLDVEAVFSVRGDGVLSLVIEAICSAPTLVNLTHHLYFNLGGHPDILGHQLWLAPESYLEADADFLPTGAVKGVEDSLQDFRVRRDLGSDRTVFNHSFVLGQRVKESLSHAATLYGPDGVEMSLWTNQTALHFYNGYKIPAGDMLTSGHESRRHSGVCLEPQGWTDAPNHPEFPDIVLRSGERYRWATEYRFRKASAGS